jgi:hypothetical protein
MQQAMTLAPALQAAGGPLAQLFSGLIGAGKQKWTEKLPIPEKEYPDYNFMGLIIGPRGKSFTLIIPSYHACLSQSCLS